MKAIDRLKKYYADKTQPYKASIAWYHLKRVIAQCCESAQGHEANGLKPGDAEFVELYRITNEALDNYLRVANDPEKHNHFSVEVRLPNLGVLHRLAFPAPAETNSHASTVGVGLLAIVFGTIAVSVLIGFGEAIVHVISNLVR